MSNTWKIILIILAMLIVLAIVRAVVIGSIAKTALKNQNQSLGVQTDPNYKVLPGPPGGCPKGMIWTGRNCIQGTQGV